MKQIECNTSVIISTFHTAPGIRVGREDDGDVALRTASFCVFMSPAQAIDVASALTRAAIAEVPAKESAAPEPSADQPAEMPAAAEVY